MRLRLCSYNIHKGFSQFNRHMAIHELRERLHLVDPDIVFLQEVQGQHLLHERRHANWPTAPQHEFLAQARWQAAYGGNAAYDHGHHGNAVLARYEIESSSNEDVTQHRLERRGLLHCTVRLPGGPLVHCLSVHLSLTEAQRRRQYVLMHSYVERCIPHDAPMIIAGDFNDWRNRAAQGLMHGMGLTEAFTSKHGQPARSFPSTVPVLRLDRIYLRGFAVRDARVLSGKPWSNISDHAALTAEVQLL